MQADATAGVDERCGRWTRGDGEADSSLRRDSDDRLRPDGRRLRDGQRDGRAEDEAE